MGLKYLEEKGEVVLQRYSSQKIKKEKHLTQIFNFILNFNDLVVYNQDFNGLYLDHGNSSYQINNQFVFIKLKNQILINVK